MYLTYEWSEGPYGRSFRYDTCDEMPVGRDNVVCIDTNDTGYVEGGSRGGLWVEYERMVGSICKRLDGCDEETRRLLVAELAGMERAMRVFVKYEY